MRQEKIKTERVRVFIILRLFIVTFLLFLAHYFFRIEGVFFYCIIAFVCFLSLIYLIWLVYGKYLKLLTWTQIFFDILLETALIHYTGSVDSLFAPIYVLSILSAGTLIAPWTSFVIAGIASALFSGVVVLNYFQVFPGFFPMMNSAHTIEHDSLYLFYATYVRITIFFVVAVLTNHLTRMIERLEEKIRIQERLAFLGDITSAIAHEIRNPLAAISGSIEVLSEDLKSLIDDKNQKLMTAVVEESDRLKRIFSRILDYSRLGELKLERQSLNQLLDGVLFLFEQSKEFDSKVTVIKKYQNQRMDADVDSEQMIDVFSNIVRNAMEAMPEGGQLVVEIERLTDEIQILFSDTGQGIKKEVLKNLFLPFKTTKKTGTGLGLAQAQKIVALHGGSIQIKSKAGAGTQVYIRLKKS